MFNLNFDASGDTFKGLLTSTRYYIIPRFQREFSWEKNNYKEFLDDIISQIKYENEKFFTNKYYLGNMIFLGTRDKESVQVIDGQQRLTTGTILLAALRNSLYEISEDKNDNAMNYAETIQKEYLVKKIDGTPQRKLETTTSFPYFAETIQDGNKQEEKSENYNKTNEEESLQKTFEYFIKQLDFKNISKYLYNNLKIDHSKETENSKDLYVKFLKAIRDTFLESEIVAIFVANENEAYRIFENINSKGKPLSQVDLIKNDIFSKVDLSDAGVDTPVEFWAKINKTLSNLDTNFNEFFLHFWKSMYPNDSANGHNLYKKYINRFDKANKNKLLDLLKDLDTYSEEYSKIISPSKDDYKKQQDKSLYRSLDNINKLRGVQSRVPILTLFIKIKDKDFEIKHQKLVDFMSYLSNFHFAVFGTSLTFRSNLTTTPYKNFCIKIVNSSTKEEIYNAMDELKTTLSGFINKNEFINSFQDLYFSKKDARKNFSSYPASYAIKTIANKLDKRSFDDSECTIEHIIDESDQENISEVQKIGNLTILEKKYNDDLSKKNNNQINCKYKKDTYEKSKYNMTNKFFSNYNNFENNNVIIDRSKKLAVFFFENFL